MENLDHDEELDHRCRIERRGALIVSASRRVWFGQIDNAEREVLRREFRKFFQSRLCCLCEGSFQGVINRDGRELTIIGAQRRRCGEEEGNGYQFDFIALR